MKTLTATLTVILAIAATSLTANNATSSTGEPKEKKAQISLKNAGEISISLGNTASDFVTLEVYNSNGSLILDKNMDATETNRVSHNVIELPAGFYTYVIKDDTSIVYAADVIKGENCAVEVRSNQSVSNASIVELNNDMVQVNIANSEKTKTVLIISDQEGNVLNRKTVKTAGNVKLSHDISTLPEGSYKFEVYHQGAMIACKTIAR